MVGNLRLPKERPMSDIRNARGRGQVSDNQKPDASVRAG